MDAPHFYTGVSITTHRTLTENDYTVGAQLALPDPDTKTQWQSSGTEGAAVTNPNHSTPYTASTTVDDKRPSSLSHGDPENTTPPAAHPATGSFNWKCGFIICVFAPLRDAHEARQLSPCPCIFRVRVQTLPWRGSPRNEPGTDIYPVGDALLGRDRDVRRRRLRTCHRRHQGMPPMWLG
ncbi:hypothetical protein BD413DRAFT_234689 [Trametes elegans]|nr:hypothetical protein BD413DRAFT_234689 [Trametes elegans]